MDSSAACGPYTCSCLYLKAWAFFNLYDGLKFSKEEIVFGHVNKTLLLLAPIVAMVPALTTMTVLLRRIR